MSSARPSRGSRRRTREVGICRARAGVSSFGFGGANAHVLFEEYLGPAPAEATRNNAPDARKAHAFVLSAKNENASRKRRRQLLRPYETNHAGCRRCLATFTTGTEPYRVHLRSARDVRREPGLKASSLQE